MNQQKHCKSPLTVLAMLTAVLWLLTACAPAMSAEKQQLSQRAIQRCTKVWNAMQLDSQGTRPQDCSWIYEEYSDRTAVVESDQLTSNPSWYTWLPRSGYIVLIGKVAVLCDSNDRLIGYYADSNNSWVEYTPTGNDLEKLLARSGANAAFNLMMSGCVLSGYFAPSFDEFDPETNTGFFRLTDTQVKKIK